MSMIEQWLKEHVPGKWMTRGGDVVNIVREGPWLVDEADRARSWFSEDGAYHISRDKSRTDLIAPVGVWLEHDGGECPVPGGTFVSIRRGHGETPMTFRSESLEWKNVNRIRDITHFRIEESQQAQEQQAHAMSAIDWAKFCSGMQWGDVRVDSEGRVTETPVAHAMSQSEAVQHVSDAAAAAYGEARRESLEHACSSRGNVLRTVEEWQSLVDQLAAKTTECEMLTRENQRKQDEGEMMADVIHEQQRIIERLREGREAYTPTPEQIEAVRAAMPEPKPQWHGGLLLTPSLDPRLGVPQPEGEPVQPMPYWRRSGV